MSIREKFIKRADSTVTAVQLNLDTQGLTYHKWGSEQRCRAGDWIVNNNGDTYTVSESSFAATYEQVSPGVYRKTAPIWAEQADKAGSIRTQEGETRYQRGDYLVFNDEAGVDGYAVSKATFERLYAPVSSSA